MGRFSGPVGWNQHLRWPSVFLCLSNWQPALTRARQACSPRSSPGRRRSKQDGSRDGVADTTYRDAVRVECMKMGTGSDLDGFGGCLETDVLSLKRLQSDSLLLTLLFMQTQDENRPLKETALQFNINSRLEIQGV